MDEPTEAEVEMAAQAIYQMRYNIEFERASAVERELSIASARAALRAAALVRPVSKPRAD
jgi:hypothetical protein